ncbi:probable phosphatase phospho1 [Cyprinus carpio]|nr:probable phosphatase phospho1 [Cyprinus carpio]XP_018929818.1 probable phosphatase phospho1 [Cyprinus carpio]XP_042582918.1 probable phosphatase phospho1 [Cyprinus carpio]XP_042582925.1 probable phosphatase phospho1 [Cyprinus carpio]
MMRDSVFNCCVSPPHPPRGVEEHHQQHSSRAQAPPPNDRRFLIFFDFDETLVDECSDDSMVTVAPGGVLPGWLKDTYRSGRYNEYMQCVLAYLSEQGITPAAIRGTVEKLPPCPGIPTLMHFLLSQPSRDFEVVCVSDANTVFIETWLKHLGFLPLFLRIFTNPAHFDDNGQLQLRPFHSHECLRCPANMCKAVVVRQYVAQRVRERSGRPYQKVLYVGDGANDFCPSLTLSPGDIAFPRRDFPMHKLIQEMEEAKPGEFKASVVPWNSGEDVINTLRKILERP